MTLLPLTHWQLAAAALPETLLDAPREAFSLPGAAALEAFADLLGNPDAPSQDASIAETAAFSLPALLPDGVCGEASLSREIDFGALTGERAVLEIGHIAGRGEILLGSEVIAAFDSAMPEAALFAWEQTCAPCALAVDLTDALRLGRRETLTLRFGDARPAGADGPIMLRTTTRAHLSRVSIRPDSARRAMTVQTQITAAQAGTFLLRVLPIAPSHASLPQSAREISLQLAAGESRSAQLSLEVPADAFVPGQAYAPTALRIQLLARIGKKDLLCDDTLLSCGYGAKAPRAYLPLTQEDCTGDPPALIARLRALHIHAVSLPASAPERMLLALDRAGVSACVFAPVDDPRRAMLTRHPCVSLQDLPPCAAPSAEESAWQLCASVAFPRALDASLTPDELLLEAAGRELHAQDEGVRRVLSWLRAVSVRLRAEAARQGRCEGALCAPGEDRDEDIRAALETAFAPVHLSALPLCGAWWTGMRFSAALEAFIPESGAQAVAVLESEDGSELARFCAPCKKSGYVGVIEAVLPDRPCVLTLTTRLEQGGSVMNESSLPVYVGERGPLEAAFA